MMIYSSLDKLQYIHAVIEGWRMHKFKSEVQPVLTTVAKVVCDRLAAAILLGNTRSEKTSFVQFRINK